MLNKKFLDQANFELQVREDINSIFGTNVNVLINFRYKPIVLIYLFVVMHLFLGVRMLNLYNVFCDMLN